jgi:hypothetical protein
MLAQTITHIPSPDMLGLPMPAWLGQCLMALTLAIHWAFLSMTAGGLVGLHLGRGDGDARRRLAGMTVLTLAMAMTVGIAPLLFVQVLYGQFFYSANILMGYVWLGLLPIMIAAFYLIYYCRRLAAQGRSTRLPAGLALLLMGLAAVILVANATLAQTPQAWRAFAEFGAVRPYMGDPAFWARWTLAAATMLAGGGLFLAIWRQATAGAKNATNATSAANAMNGVNEENATGGKSAANAGVARVSSIRRPAVAGLLGLAGMLGAAAWAAWAQPAEMIRALIAGPEYAVAAYAVIAAIALAIVLSILAVRRPSLSRLVPAAVVMFIALLAIAAVRDAIRRAALRPAFDLLAVPVHAQWDSFALWAVVFIAGLALVAYMIALTVRSKPAAQ